MAVLLGLGVVALYFRWFVKQLGPNGFSANYFEDWGHAYFVPIVCGFFIWKNRERLARLEVRPYWPALVMLPLSVFAYLYFVLVYSNHMFQGFAMILAVAGTVLLVAGPGLAPSPPAVLP